MSNTEIVQAIYEAFAVGDIPSVLAALDPDVEWIEPDLDSLPYQGVTKGVDQVARQVFAAIPATYERLAFTPERLLGSGDTVAVLGTGTAVGPGGEHRFRFAHVVELRRGRVVRMNGFADTHRLALALARA